MNISELKDFLLWCTAINYGLLLLWFGVFLFAHGWLYRTHASWFEISPDSFDVLQYGSMAIYKIGILQFNVVPLVALHLIS